MKVLITGCSRGIGRDTALVLREEGHEVLALSRNRKGLESLTKSPGSGPAIRVLPFDLSAPDFDALDGALRELGGLDVVLNNAGTLINKPFLQLGDADWSKVFEVNVFGVVRLLRRVYPWLTKSEQAHVLNISSMGGYQGSAKFPGLSAYSAAKGALAILTECLAEEWKDEGIPVNCLALGAVQTDMLAEAFPGYQAPLSSSEMAEFFAYFSTRGHRFFNGKILPVSLSNP